MITGDGAGLPDASTELELAPARAFSIDDETTTEIDDAFSVTRLDNGNWQVGVHIAAPALGVAPGSELDAEARKRMSTVYFPGGKVTMLPQQVIDRFTLAEGRDCPALSMYVELDSEFTILQRRTVLERVRISRNLHHNMLDDQFDDAAVAAGRAAFEFGEELLLLYRFAVCLEQQRGKNENRPQRTDYNFYVDDDRVRIVPRKRGAPLDKLVAELMILVNGEWGRLLDEAGVPGLYRTQAGGKVRMSTVAAPHEGLGLKHYVWASSPLRRYADLANQRQLISAVRESAPAYPAIRHCLKSCGGSSWPTMHMLIFSARWNVTGACAGYCKNSLPRSTAKSCATSLSGSGQFRLSAGCRRCRPRRRARSSRWTFPILI